MCSTTMPQGCLEQSDKPKGCRFLRQPSHSKGDNMKQAVMYGGGNIGRGFIGALASQSGCRVTLSMWLLYVLRRTDGRLPA